MPAFPPVINATLAANSVMSPPWCRYARYLDKILTLIALTPRRVRRKSTIRSIVVRIDCVEYLSHNAVMSRFLWPADGRVTRSVDIACSFATILIRIT